MSTNHTPFPKQGAIAEGVSIRDGVDKSLDKHLISIDFYTDDSFSVAVDKTTMSGTVTFEVSESGLDYSYGSIDSGVVTLGTEKYDRPFVGLGSISHVKATFAAVTGATHYKYTVDSFRG